MGRILGSLRAVAELGALFGARGDVFHPFVDCRLLLRHATAARPEPFDEPSQAVFGSGRFACNIWMDIRVD